MKSCKTQGESVHLYIPFRLAQPPSAVLGLLMANGLLKAGSRPSWGRVRFHEARDQGCSDAIQTRTRAHKIATIDWTQSRTRWRI